MGDDDTHKNNLRGLFFKSASEHASTKDKLIKIMALYFNEVHSDEEDIVQEEDEDLCYDKEVVQIDGEGDINPLGSTKNVIEGHMQVDKSLVNRHLLRCKNLKTREVNVLKIAVDSFLIPL